MFIITIRSAAGMIRFKYDSKDHIWHSGCLFRTVT